MELNVLKVAWHVIGWPSLEHQSQCGAIISHIMTSLISVMSLGKVSVILYNALD